MGVKQVVGAILVGFSLIAWVIADAANLVGNQLVVYPPGRMGRIFRGNEYHFVGIHYIVLIGLVFAVGIVLLIWDWRGQLTNILVWLFPRREWGWGWVFLVVLLAMLLVMLIAAILYPYF